MTAIGVDVGGTTIKALSLSPGENRSVTQKRPLPADPEDVLRTVTDLVSELRSPQVEAVGIGVAGLVKWPEGRFLWGPHVEGTEVPFRTALERSTSLPVTVDNDANCAALAELRLGAARGIDQGVVLTLGTGIGGGLIVNGQIYRGHGLAGEVGHMVMEPDGDRCACGGRGCWETRVSGHQLDLQAERLAENDPEGIISRLAAGSVPTGHHLTMAAEDGDEEAAAVLMEMGRWLGRGVANLVAILDPQLVVVGGAASEAGDWLLEPARQELELAVEGAGHRPPVVLLPALFGSDGPAVGAALAAIERLEGDNGQRGRPHPTR